MGEGRVLFSALGFLMDGWEDKDIRVSDGKGREENKKDL